ncbi:PaaI family thioesterase [Methylobacterium sp. C25]|uniref:PaaI family thioesterase n=1 Tax=Methylobacterium sp. C25 TaxID=2721622 RepID=UPI001F3D6757|nr:PaaI family thioesterase [Methylobacterium sp. C25]MCE4222808.1 PaaI family thioesterase [Methylobacterium sp. C25]
MGEGRDETAFPAGWTAFDDPGFVALTGPVHHRLVEGRKQFAFKAEQKHVNLVGLVHGGMLVTFADRSLSIVAMEAMDGASCVTLEMNVHFVGAAKIGDLVETVPEIVRKTSSLVFVRSILTSGGRPLVTVSGIWKVLKDRS